MQPAPARRSSHHEKQLGAGQRSGDIPMTTTNETTPWQPSPSPSASVPEAIYKQLMFTLAVIGRSAEEVQTLAAVVALIDATRDLMVRSGALWHSQHNMADVLRCLAAELDRLRGAEEHAPPPLLETLKETMASCRPKHMN
jgi:hypothetical protein